MESLPAAAASATKRKRLTNTQRQIRQRREEVFKLLLKNLTEREIAETLGVSQSTISDDVKALQQEANDSLHEVVETILPFRFYRAEQVVQETQRQAWLLYHDTADPVVKLRCLKEIREAEGMGYEILRGGRGLIVAQKVRHELDEILRENEELRRRDSGRWSMSESDEEKEA